MNTGNVQSPPHRTAGWHDKDTPTPMHMNISISTTEIREMRINNIIFDPRRWSVSGS